MHAWNASDLHLPAILISSSENPLLNAVVAAPTLNEYKFVKLLFYLKQ